MLNHLIVECQRQHQVEVQAQAVPVAARPAETVTPDIVARAVVQSSREAYRLALGLLAPSLMPVDAVVPQPEVPVQQLEALGFGVEYRKAANDAFQRFGAEGDWARHNRRARYRFEQFQRAAARGLRS